MIHLESPTPSASEDAYRLRWSWERVASSSHCGNCIANCTYRHYVDRDGGTVLEEPSGDVPGLPGVPDGNPLGCQKGVAWQAQLLQQDRLRTPLRRSGPRGSGRFEEISWEEAFTQVADAIVDALAADGSDAVLLDNGAESGVLASSARTRLALALDAVSPDANATVSDVHLGHWTTFGGLLGGSSADDTFRAELVLVWNGNPAFTRIPYAHYLTEARYRGALVVLVAPDYSPSAVHADLFVPLRPGTDAALLLSACQVLLEEGLADLDFARSQTDLPLLVRTRTGRFLREADLAEAGRSDRFLAWWDGRARPVDPARLDDPRAPRPYDLSGRHVVRLADDSEEEVSPVALLLRERLRSYRPEDVAPLCGVAPSTVRELARLVARRRTKVVNGLGSCKHYHGDLMERSLDLLLALSGNWGRPGTGLDTYIIALLEGEVLSLLKQGSGAAAADEALEAIDALVEALRATDPATSEARAYLRLLEAAAPPGASVPPAFLFYHHCGYAELWDRPGYHDAPRATSAYVEDAKASGAWDGLVRPARDVAPRVLLQAGTNVLRRTRGGQRMLLEHLWPRLEMVVTVDWRLGGAALWSDVVLPVAAEGERVELHGANSHAFERAVSEKVREPPPGVRSEWEVFAGLAAAISARARARGLSGFRDHLGGQRSFEAVPAAFGGERPRDPEAVLDEILRDSALSGNLPEGTTLSSLRRQGWVSPRRLPRAVAALAGGDLVVGEPFVAYRRHVEEGLPFPTLTGRAQFYVDHPWWLEAGEELPCHKEPPAAGGDHPLVLTGGHPRWSIHATNTTNRVLLETTRGRPVVSLNPLDAAARGIEDNDLVEVFNDLGSLVLEAKLAPGVRPGQVVLYASWEPHLFSRWQDATLVEPGIVKWLHVAAGYGHLAYSPLQWQPTQSDRVYRVDVRLADTDRHDGGGD